MSLSVNGKNVMVDALTAVATYVSLHSAMPNGSGSNELSGGSPAYARKAHTWNAASGGSGDDSNQPVFDVPASSTVAWVGLWGAITGGTFYGAGPAGSSSDPTPFQAANAGDLFTADNHGYTDGQSVVLIDVGGGGVIPTGVVEGTTYFIVSASTDTFQLAATSGGSAIAISSDGAGFVQRIVQEGFTLQGLYTLSDADISLLG